MFVIHCSAHISRQLNMHLYENPLANSNPHKVIIDSHRLAHTHFAPKKIAKMPFIHPHAKIVKNRKKRNSKSLN